MATERGEFAFKARAQDVVVVPLQPLVQLLTDLEEDHLDHGRRLQAAGVRSAIALVQDQVRSVSGIPVGPPGA